MIRAIHIKRKMMINFFLWIGMFALVNPLPIVAQRSNSPVYIKKTNIVYTKTDSLKADIYIPSDNEATQFPILIFINGSGFRNFRDDPHYYKWTKEAASRGFVSVIFDITAGNLKNNFLDLLSFLGKNKIQYKADTSQVGIYAGSGNVVEGMPLANELREIKAALIFYGVAVQEKFRLDLPVYLVRACLDNIGLNKKIDSLAFKALQANAPYTIVNLNIAQHAFESDSNAIAEDQIQNALQFLRRNMYLQSSQKKSYDSLYSSAVAFRELYNGNYDNALSAFKEILRKDTADNEADRTIADIYIEKRSYDSALLYYDKAILHGNWRKGEIRLKKVLAYSKLNRINEAIEDLRFLKKIGWFKETDYTIKDDYKNLVQSKQYADFVKEK